MPCAGPWCGASSAFVPSNPGQVLALPVGGCSQNSIHPSFAFSHSSGELLEMVPWCLLHAGKVCRGETRQPETAVQERQVHGAGVTVLMTIGKSVLGSREIEDGEKKHTAKGCPVGEAMVRGTEDAHEEQSLLGEEKV